MLFFFFSSRRRHTRLTCDWSSDVCSSDVDLLAVDANLVGQRDGLRVVHEVVQLVDQDEYIHGFSESTEGVGSVVSPEPPAPPLRLGLRLGLSRRFWARRV